MNTYLTEWKEGEKTFGGEIEAFNWFEAQKIADFNNRGEKVIGLLVEEIEANPNTFLPMNQGRN